MVRFALPLALVVSLVACDKLKGGGADGGTTSTGGGGKKTSVKLAELTTPYNKDVNNTDMKTPMDKKVATFLGKVPKPELDTPTKKTWHAVDDKGECWKAVLDTKDGSLLQDQVQKSDCGL